LRPMSEYFDFSCSEMTQVFVWIKFPTCHWNVGHWGVYQSLQVFLVSQYNVTS
jgi:hypothetical protein